MKSSLVVSILVLGLSFPSYAGVIQGVADNGPVGKYDKFEITFDPGETYKNPFDPLEVDATVEFKSPSGFISVVRGFVYQDYQRTGDFNSQTLTPLGGLVWKARFAPGEEGKWSYQVQVKDASGVHSAPERSFIVKPSAGKGFVRVSKKDPDYFAFDNGDSYFPLGENIGWSSSGRTYQFDKWVGSLAANGGNFIRVWQANWHTEYEWAYSYPATTQLPGNYMDRLREAWELDYILDLCAQKNVYVMLCLINHGKFSSTTNPNWKDNPYNKKANPKGGFMEKPEELWSNERTKLFIRRNWRYLVARYAHNTSLQSWELFNEMEWIDNYSASVTDSVKFHQEMGGYLKSIDPYQHLLTTSYAHALNWPTDVWNAGMEFTQDHNYGGLDMAQVADGLTAQMKGRCPGKPFVIGEMGIGGNGGSENEKDPGGLFIHNTNWGSLTAKAAGGGFPWWWDNYVEPKNLYFRWKGISAFVLDEDMDNRGYKSTAFTVTTPQMTDLSFSPGTTGWGIKAGANHFTLGQDGSITPPESNLTGFVYSTAKAEFRNPPVFHVEMSKPGKFRVRLNSVSSWGTNNITIQLDGKPTEVNNTPAAASTAYEIEVPSGSHEISVDSTGQDWVQVASYAISNYVGALRCKALNGRDRILGRIQSRSFDYSNSRPPAVKGGILRLSGLNHDGPWRVEWWDTEKGVKRGVGKIKVKRGSAGLALPVITTDLAFKAYFSGVKKLK